MDQINDTMGMLDLMVRPAFIVKDHCIIRVNQAARRCLIAEGTPLDQLLVTGTREYEEMESGCLYLSLSLSGINRGASVTRMQEFDVFTLDDEGESDTLQALALAAMELRDPLSGVMTAADRLFPNLDSQDPALQDQLSRINRGLYQLLRLVGNMADAGRYTTEAPFGMVSLDVCRLMEETFEKAAVLLHRTGIHLHFQGINSGIYCLANPEKLERAVYNILSNAVKFTSRDGYIEAKLTRRGDRLYLTVQDSGTGIAQDIRSNVFTRYQRQPGLEDGRYGIGLGMVLVRSVAAIHGGTVLLEQMEGNGARVTMTIAIRQRTDGMVRSPLFHVDYAGERDHALIELSDTLPATLYQSKDVN